MPCFLLVNVLFLLDGCMYVYTHLLCALWRYPLIGTVRRDRAEGLRAAILHTPLSATRTYTNAIAQETEQVSSPLSSIFRASNSIYLFYLFPVPVFHSRSDSALSMRKLSLKAQPALESSLLFLSVSSS